MSLLLQGIRSQILKSMKTGGMADLGTLSEGSYVFPYIPKQESVCAYINTLSWPKFSGQGHVFRSVHCPMHIYKATSTRRSFLSTRGEVLHRYLDHFRDGSRQSNNSPCHNPGARHPQAVGVAHHSSMIKSRFSAFLANGHKT